MKVYRCERTQMKEYISLDDFPMCSEEEILSNVVRIKHYYDVLIVNRFEYEFKNVCFYFVLPSIYNI